LLVSLHATSLFSLEGKTAVLTGASGFLGRTFARTLLSNGARLIALGRSERLEALSTEWSREFGAERVCACRVDMYDLQALTESLDEIVAREPTVDILVNNAYELGPNTGFNTDGGALDVAPLEQWMRHFTAGTYWPALAVQKLGPAMKTCGQGSIVNISTMYAVVAPDPRLYEGTKFLNPPGYSAAKAAMLAFTRYVASFWGADGIRANAILPGPFSNTEETGSNAVAADDPFLERLRERTCLGRLGRPEELAGALLFLASDASSYVTGHALIVDGGWTTI
jgi:NAD(P)-dependent dehydrogenase (short-subunit alcohol dehydrogenase family)